MRELGLLLPDWNLPASVRAVMTTREGGRSRGPYESFNLGAHVGDDDEAVHANRRRLAARLGLVREPAWLRQVHGATVVRAESVTEDTEADASWTDQPGVACVVMVADCLPVLLASRDGERVAAAHAGWRGLAAGVLEETVRALGGGELTAWLGPAIGPDRFEVGPEVREAFVARSPEHAQAFREGDGDRWLCDIYLLARRQLAALGVHDVHGGGFCTVTDPRFFSFRRDGVTGRMAALIWRE